jgi:hypothetical protein
VEGLLDYAVLWQAGFDRAPANKVFWEKPRHIHWAAGSKL